MEKLEKVIWILAGVMIAAVIGFVVMGPLKSGISDDEALYAMRQANPNLRRGAQRYVPPAPDRVAQPQQFGPQQTGGRQVGAAQVRQQPQPGQPAAPQQQQQPSPYAPQTPYNPGVVVAEPVYIPEVVVEKYRHWEDIYDLSLTAYGEDITLPDGTIAFGMREIQENSPLRTMLDFRPGDTIISVNGYPANKANARQLYETLKHETTFNVEVLRNGQRQTLVYHRGAGPR